MFSFQVLFVPFSLMIIFLINFCVGICSNMFKHVQTYTKARDLTPRMVFFLMLNQNSGAVDVYGIMQSVITVLSSHMLLSVALCSFIYCIIYTYTYVYI